MLLLAVAVLVTVSASCGREAPADPGQRGSVVIAIAGPLTGADRELGEAITRSAELAREHVKTQGLLSGRQLELILADDQSRPEEARVVAARLAGDARIPVVIGHVDAACRRAAAEIYRRNGVVLLSPGRSMAAAGRGGERSLRGPTSLVSEGRLLARYARQVLGATRAVVIVGPGERDEGLRAAFTRQAAELGLEVVGVERVAVGEPADSVAAGSYAAVLARTVAWKPDLVLLDGTHRDATEILLEARAGGIEAPFIAGHEVMAPELIAAAGEAAEGMLVAVPPVVDERLAPARSREVRAEFTARWGTTPDARAALTYDAIIMAAQAVATVGSDRKAVRGYFASIEARAEAFEGISGPLHFDAECGCLRPALVARVQGGRFVAAGHQALGDEERLMAQAVGSSGLLVPLEVDGSELLPDDEPFVAQE